MTTHLLDTTIVSSFLLGRQPFWSIVAPLVDDAAAATSILVVGEVIEHLLGRGDEAERIEALDRLLDLIAPLPVTREIAGRYATPRRRLRPPHGPGLIGDVDTLIAATALEHDLTLVTSDRDFARVSDPRLLFVPRR